MHDDSKQFLPPSSLKTSRNLLAFDFCSVEAAKHMLSAW